MSNTRKQSSGTIDIAELAAALMGTGMSISICIEPADQKSPEETQNEEEWDALMEDAFNEFTGGSTSSTMGGGGGAFAASGILQGVNTP